MNALPTNIDIAKARLPATYEQAKIALASCLFVGAHDRFRRKAYEAILAMKKRR
ncbi:hypothetical protein [Bradyrhizobium sp. Tv2a-2]|uniref:hypothetical protein n=1 Tax=Bradyrhizobium sp. Tv2a-2 TaxID=113395 RepID=UPI000429E2D3|nr:hypothetical protein [Bradyrhizobium sp. Tv2a-2]